MTVNGVGGEREKGERERGEREGGRRNEGEGKTRTGSRTYRQKETKDREEAREIMGEKRGMQIHTKRWRWKKLQWPAGQRETGKKRHREQERGVTREAKGEVG